MKNTRSISSWSIILGLAFATLLVPPAALAQSWTNNDSVWGNTDSWNPATVPNSAGAVVNLMAPLSGQQNADLDGNTYTLGILNIGSTSGAGYFYLNGGTLNFDNNGSGAVINHISTSAGEQLNNLVINLSDNLTINENQTGTTGTPYGFEFGYGEGTSVTGIGNLTVNNNNPNGDQFGGKASVAAYGSIDNTGELIFSGTGAGYVNLFDPVGSNVTQIIQNSATSTTYIGNGMSGTTSVLIMSGTLGFGGGSGFDQPSQVIVGDTAAHGPGSTLDVRGITTWTMGAAQTLSGFGTVLNSGAITAVAGTTIAPGSTGHIGTLDITSDLILSGNTNLAFVLGTGTSSALSVGGNLTLAGSKMNLELSNNNNADGLGSIASGTYVLVDYNSLTGASAGDITSLFNVTGPGGYSYDITDTGVNAGTIDLTVTAVPEPGSMALLLGGGGVILVLARKRRVR
jgi:hypothetical protein